MKFLFKFLLVSTLVLAQKQYGRKSPTQEMEKINKQFHSLIRFNYVKCKIKEKLLAKIDDLTSKAIAVFERCGSIPGKNSRSRYLMQNGNYILFTAIRIAVFFSL